MKELSCAAIVLELSNQLPSLCKYRCFYIMNVLHRDQKIKNFGIYRSVHCWTTMSSHKFVTLNNRWPFAAFTHIDNDNDMFEFTGIWIEAALLSRHEAVF